MVVKMTNAFSSIKQGLQEAVDYSEGKLKKAVIHEFSPLDVKKFALALACLKASLPRRLVLV